jgi:hypothetical protein
MAPPAWAQDATIAGAVRDQTGAVLPGVTITILHESSGNTFVPVTDAAGTFRLPVRTGSVKVATELSCFSGAPAPLEIGVGQAQVINVQIMPEALRESVIVVGQAPPVDPTQSKLSGNISPSAGPTSA